MAARGLSPAATPGHPPGAWLRFLLGMAQIAGAGFSLGLLLASGLTPLALGAVAGTCALTAASLLLHRGRGQRS